MSNQKIKYGLDELHKDPKHIERWNKEIQEVHELIDDINIEFAYFKRAVKEFGMLASPFEKHKKFKYSLHSAARMIADSAKDVRQRKIWWKR
ncbi:MAG: hypothetical protein ACR2NF_03865 [Pirellulales bacterium]